MDTDINYIIQMSINGDKNYQEILLKRLNPLIYKNIYKYYEPTSPLIDDLKQEGYMLVLESLSSYNPNKNVHFLHYIKTKLMYFYMNYYRNTKNQKDEINYSEVENYLSIENNLDLVIEKDKLKNLLDNLNSLSEIEQKIIKLFYYEEKSIIEISQLLNIDYNACRRKKQLAVEKLRKLTAAWR